MVDELCSAPSHWNAKHSLDEWLSEQGITGICGVDTRELTAKIRERGTMLGKIIVAGGHVQQVDPGLSNLVAKVSTEVKQL